MIKYVVIDDETECKAQMFLEYFETLDDAKKYAFSEYAHKTNSEIKKCDALMVVELVQEYETKEEAEESLFEKGYDYFELLIDKGVVYV